MSGLPTVRPCGREPVNPSALRRNPVQLPISRLGDNHDDASSFGLQLVRDSRASRSLRDGMRRPASARDAICSRLRTRGVKETSHEEACPQLAMHS